jgi:hypothetical protein
VVDAVTVIVLMTFMTESSVRTADAAIPPKTFAM